MSNFNKKTMSEEDIKYRCITPAIENAGWDKNQIRFEHSFTDGRIRVQGKKVKRGKRKFADYLLYYKSNMPLAVVEAKDNNHGVRDGIQQAINYGDILDVPFVYSSNGDSFFEHDRLTGFEREIALTDFPSPDELWGRFKSSTNTTKDIEEIVSQPYYYEVGGKKPRYYQRIAVNRVVRKIAEGKKRLLLVMATGTGKTFTAFQIVHRLKKAGKVKKVLYLADRNILVDQAMNQDFKPFGNIMTKISNRKLDSSYEIYFALYQQLAEHDGKRPYAEFKPEFFDLIIVDECHRGSAKEDSQWREILEYFYPAIQIGMTATPKEEKDVSNSGYFGLPVYTYSLKDGINDGFLAPYKIVKVIIDKDVEGYDPEEGTKDKYGNEIPRGHYTAIDYDRKIVLDDRTKIVAQRITEYLKANGDEFSKTIVFCVDTEHASRMRQALINENPERVKENSKYIMRITGDDKEGKQQLDYFIDPDEKYPTIVTTSKLLSTGVDCKTCKLIVLDNNINSMIEFKQIIGRGTRLKEEYGKQYFTVMDFRNNVRLFSDPKFDGEPYEWEEIPSGGGFTEEIPPKNKPENEIIGELEPDSEIYKKYYVNNVSVRIIAETIQYRDENGKLVTENLIDYTKRNILKEYATLDTFLNKWNNDLQKQTIIDELEEEGVFLEELKEQFGNENLDDFDLICHIAYGMKPLTRSERVNNVKKSKFIEHYQGLARDVIDALLEKYMDDGVQDLEDIKIFQNEPFNKMGGIVTISNAFGGKNGLLNTMKQLQDEIYI